MVGGKTVSFEYNADSIRTKKMVTGEDDVYYRLDGDRVVEMKKGNIRYVFTYDTNGNPYSVTYYASATATAGATYYYILNLQGDVVQIINNENSVLANYRYDAWGKLLSVTDKNGNAITSASHVGNLNPIRYRGYFYDTETGLYYLNSRYYDPQMKRFINADGTVSTGQGFVGYNMFAYCNDNPVNMVDSDGKDAILLYDSDNIGHIGAMIQDEDGAWRHYYWGTESLMSRALCLIGRYVSPHKWFVTYEGELTLDEINKSKQYKYDYDEMIYLEGDFSESARIAETEAGKYNLYKNNCSQNTFKLLSKSKTKYSKSLSKVSKITIPSRAFKDFILYKEIADLNAAVNSDKYYDSYSDQYFYYYDAFPPNYKKYHITL